MAAALLKTLPSPPWKPDWAESYIRGECASGTGYYRLEARGVCR